MKKKKGPGGALPEGPSQSDHIRAASRQCRRLWDRLLKIGTKKDIISIRAQQARTPEAQAYCKRVGIALDEETLETEAALDKAEEGLRWLDEQEARRENP